MKPTYYLLAAIVLVLLAWPQHAAAQDFTECPTDQDECVVEWGTEEGEPIINALFNTVANDTDRPEGRVYVLKRGGFYYNEDHVSNNGFHLRLVGQTAEEGAATGENVCGPGGDEDCGPAIIQRFQREDGTTDGLMIESSGDGNSGLTLKNVWLIGRDNTGAGSYEPITINSSNSRFIFDNVIFDRNDWHHLGFKAGGNDIFVTNCHFRNLTDGTQIWSGRAIRLEAGADTVAFENNSFFNLTSFPFQSEAEPVDYFLFNHNTLVNFGRNFNAGALWKRAYVANNLMVNPFWQGESQQQYDDRLQNWLDQGNTEADLDPYIGIFSVGVLPSRFGLEVDRRVALANNSWWRDPDVETFYGDLGVHAQPLVSDSTTSFFDLYEGMVMQGNMNQNPMLSNAPMTPEVYAQMETFVTQWVNNEATPWELLYWDPDRPDNPLATVWPLQEDFSYTNEALMDAGTDGLPLGDLNWFPAAMEDYLANREAYIQAIEDLAGAPPEPPAAEFFEQAEGGQVEGGEVVSVEGFTSFFFEGSGSATWTFEVPADGEYGLNVMTNLRTETERGQHIRLDGTGLRNTDNYGEFFFCSVNSGNENCQFTLEPDSFQVVEIRQGDLIADQSGALTLTAGTHTLEIAPSWGYQEFATVEVVDASDNVVATLTPPMADIVGAQEICEQEGFCPSGFQSVSLDADGSVSWNVDIPEGINSGRARIFYQAPAGGAGTLLVDGTEMLTLSFPASEGDAAAELTSDRFPLTPGPHEITVASSSGGIVMDYAIVLTYTGTVTATEPNELPEGYALEQNYPNPFNPTTTIPFTLGAPGNVRLVVYDLLGRKVTTLVDQQMPAGTFHVTWNGTGAGSTLLASGVYFYRLETPVGQKVRSMVLMK